ncbi:hypothetical protein ACLKA6_018976 [Drosophila palustris]
MKRQRCANFTPEEEAELVALVKANQSVLENKKSDAITWKQKPSGWEKLATGVPRTVKTCHRPVKTCHPQPMTRHLKPLWTSSFRFRLGAKAAIIFSCETEPTFKAMEDLPRGQKLRSMSEDQVLRLKLSVSVSGLPPSINTNWVAGKIRALGFSPLKVTNIVGNMSGRPTSKFRVELDHHDNNDSFLKPVTLGSFEVSIGINLLFNVSSARVMDTFPVTASTLTLSAARVLAPGFRDCLVMSESDMKCANCGKGHRANWDSCPAYLDVLRSKGLSRRATRAKLAIQASGLDKVHKFRGSLAERLLSINSATAQDLPPAPQDMPPAAQDMPPAAHELSPAAEGLPPVAHVPPSEVSLDSSVLEYDFNEVGDLVKMI